MTRPPSRPWRLRTLEASRFLARVKVVAALVTGQLDRIKRYRESLAGAFDVRVLDSPTPIARDGEVGEYARTRGCASIGALSWSWPPRRAPHRPHAAPDHPAATRWATPSSAASAPVKPAFRDTCTI